MRIIGLAIVLALALPLAGCGGGGDVVLTLADSDRSVELSPGESLRLELESNATTGFSWQLVDPDGSESLHLVSTRYEAPDTELVGAGGTEIWLFRAGERGTARVELVYVRPFEPEVVERRFAVDVTVD